MKINYQPHALEITLIKGEERESASVAIPSWATCVAVDRNGVISVFDEYPNRCSEDWDNLLGSTYEIVAEVQDVVRNWENTCHPIDQSLNTKTELILLVGEES
ncbi:hypothetical protein CPT_Morttis_087 [Acinetobacter phage Morttis]|nr:hypothetical protein CPT_Maestro_090 [Acinetobacter phage Maestro]QQM18580.1 hypothetical protein CPT_Morttis_087 [Acinetobacter phage Morttis]